MRKLNLANITNKLSDIQSTILFRHGRRHTVNILIRFSDDLNPDKYQKLLKWMSDLALTDSNKMLETVKKRFEQKIDLVRNIKTTLKASNKTKILDFLPDIDLDNITTSDFETLGQIDFSQIPDLARVFKDATFEDVGIITNLFLSANAFKNILQVQSDAFNEHAAFNAGMTSERTRLKLKDTQLQYWDDAYNTTRPIDALLLLADDDLQKLATKKDHCLSSLHDLGLIDKDKEGEDYIIEIGKGTLFEKPKNLFSSKHFIEHFGYKDGISNPRFFNDQQKLKDNCSIVLHPYEDSYGSFLVYRKLEQDTDYFEEAAGQIAKKWNNPKAIEAIKENIKAQAMGRHKDGLPIEKHDQSNQEHSKNRAKLKDFEYHTNGKKCPYHAHIRKMNPKNRDQPLISRMGITYGDPPRKRNKGLLFMCFQAAIEDGFECLQERANGTLPTEGSHSVDAIIGQRFDREKPKPQRWNKQWNEVQHYKETFKTAIKLKGGEYFFAPPISFFKNLSNQHAV